MGRLTGRMLQIPRSALVAAVSVTAGGALYGVAAGGVVGMDRELQATTTPPPQVRTVEFRQVVEPTWDCSRERRSDDEGRV